MTKYVPSSSFQLHVLTVLPPPSPLLRSTIQHRYAGSSNSGSSSGSETGGDDSQEAAAMGPRLTPATMADRSSGHSLRRTPAVERRPSPSPSLLASQTMAPPIAGGTMAASRDLEREERERGNAKFARGKFDEAIKSYTRCVLALGGRKCFERIAEG